MSNYAGFLNYKGDVRGAEFLPYYADALGRRIKPVDIEYDDETNMSRVGFMYESDLD